MHLLPFPFHKMCSITKHGSPLKIMCQILIIQMLLINKSIIHFNEWMNWNYRMIQSVLKSWWNNHIWHITHVLNVVLIFLLFLATKIIYSKWGKLSKNLKEFNLFDGADISRLEIKKNVMWYICDVMQIY